MGTNEKRTSILANEAALYFSSFNNSSLWQKEVRKDFQYKDITDNTCRRPASPITLSSPSATSRARKCGHGSSCWTDGLKGEGVPIVISGLVQNPVMRSDPSQEDYDPNGVRR